MEPKEEKKTNENSELSVEEQRKKAKAEKKAAKELKKAAAKAKQAAKKEEKKDAKKQPEFKEKEVDYYKSDAKLVRPNKGQPVDIDPSINNNILITSALPYVNNLPHLGTIIGCVMPADVFARYSRLNGNRVLYVCGTDEYGTATETKALEEKCTPKELCDKYHKLHKECYEWFDIDFDFFGRTSTPQQTVITHEIFKDLFDNGFIQKKQIEQFKCPKCNMYLSDRFVYGICHHKDCGSEGARGDQCDKCGKLINALELIDPKCKLCDSTPEKVKTFHYFLELPNIETKLKAWIDKASEEGDWSANSKSITYGFLSEGLKGRCITRDLKWGVPVPSEDPDLKNKVFYVWFDAPIGYLSITANLVGDKWSEWWKNPEHVKYYEFMGKDNVTFHTVIFPSTLLGTGKNWTLLHHLSTSEYLNYEGTKFSKSKNIGIFGDNVQSTGIPSEIWRYYLLAMRPETNDTDFKWDDFQARNNNELLSNLGNLLHRVLTFTFKNFEGKIPKFNADKFNKEEDLKFLKDVLEAYKNYINYQNKTYIKDALKTVMEISAIGNAYMQNTEPWTLLKKNSEAYDLERAQSLFNVLCNLVRLIGGLAEPFMPSFSAKLYELMNIKYEGKELCLIKNVNDWMKSNPEHEEMFLIKCGLIEEGHSLNQPHPLFKKITDEEIDGFKKKFGSMETLNKP